VARYSYFHRIARADADRPSLRPRPAVFRRWEAAQLPLTVPEPATGRASPESSPPRRPARVSEAAPVNAVRPGPKRLTESLPRSLPAVPADAHRPLSPKKPAPKKSEANDRVEPATRSNRTYSKKGLPTPEFRSSRDLEFRIVRPEAGQVAESDFDPGPEPELKRKISRRSATDTSPAGESSATSAAQPGSRSLNPKEAARSSMEPVAEAVPTLRPARSARDDEQQNAIVKIGNIDVQVMPQPVPAPPANAKVRSERKGARSLSRAFTSSFGLRQG
jgi:hypothetical protein